jgi:O-antigen/teichoic acid export membrane protein
MPIYTGLESVLPTLLVKLREDPQRQMAALVRAMRAVVGTAVPLAITFALAAPLIVHLLWHGKWDVAIRPTQILAACVPPWLIIHSVRALLEARGYWRLRFGLLALNGVGGITAAALGTCFGGVTEITLTVAVFYVLLGLSLVLALRRLGLTAHDVSSIALQPVALNCAALAASLAIRHWVFPDSTGAVMDSLCAAIFLLLVGVGNITLLNYVWMDLWKSALAARS